MPDVNDLKSWTREEVRELLGDLKAEAEADARYAATRRKVFARCKWPELFEKYAGKYVGAYDGEIRVVADTSQELWASADGLGIPHLEFAWERIQPIPTDAVRRENRAEPER